MTTLEKFVAYEKKKCILLFIMNAFCLGLYVFIKLITHHLLCSKIFIVSVTCVERKKLRNHVRNHITSWESRRDDIW